MTHDLRRLALLVLTIGLLLIPALIPVPAQAQTEALCFEQTSICIGGRIREFWEQNDGMRVFGLPITPLRPETINGQTVQVQWFERNRLELHPENARPYDVLLGRLGVDALAQQGRNWTTFPQSGPREGCRFFPETGQSVCGNILTAWQSSGLELNGQPGSSVEESLALFGLPISPEQVERLSDGKDYIVQWFERARFELHPEAAPPYNVQLGRLGVELVGTGGTAAPPTAAPPTPAPETQCADVPPPVNGRIRPSSCVERGTTIRVDAFGFQPNEQVGFWLTAPDASVYGTIETVDIGSQGAVSDLPLRTNNLDPGLWYLVFEGVASKHQAIIYFKILAPGGSPAPTPPGNPPAQATCDDVPPPVSARIRPSSCVTRGTQLVIDVFGFTPNEQVGFWFTAPDGAVYGTIETVNIGPQGAASNLPLDTNQFEPGLWSLIFEGVESKHQARIYFKIL